MTESTGRVERIALPAAFLRWLSPTILVLGVVAGVLVVAAWQQEASAKATEVRVLARGAANDMDRFLTSQLATVQAIAASDPVVNQQPDAMRALFDRVNPASIGFDGQLSWVDEGGVMRARSNYDGPDLDLSDREWVQQVLQTRAPYVSNARLGQVNNGPVVVFAVPTTGRDGRPTGILAAAMRLDRARDAAYSFRTAGGTSVTIIDRIGQIVAGPDPVTDLRSVTTMDYRALRAQGEGVLTDATGPTGDTGRLIGYAAVPLGEWLLLVDESRAEALGPATTRAAGQLALIAAFTALAVAVAVWSSRRVNRALAAQERALQAEQASAHRLEELVEELRQREELRDAFVGVLSHELRTPATTIYGMTAILARSPDRDDRLTMIEDIRDEADRLNRIIEDLLVLSRAERRVLAVGAEPVLVQRLMPAIAADISRQHRGIDLRLDVPAHLPPVVAEEGALRQVLFNLLSNAAKYGGGSPVRVEGRADDGTVTLVVADDGPGFPGGDAERLFELYYRSPHTARHASGTGIGLFVVRQLVQAMGGTVSASAAPGAGATFTVTLDVYEGDPEEHAEDEVVLASPFAGGQPPG